MKANNPNQIWESTRDAAHEALANGISAAEFISRYPAHRRTAAKAYEHAVGFQKACADTMRYSINSQD